MCGERGVMEDGEVELWCGQEMSEQQQQQQVPSSSSLDSFFDEILRDAHACTHTHTCNPPGPDSSHTHTCFHVHTKILAPPSAVTDDTAQSAGNTLPKKRPSGNREAVRKYREKKKARAASLEDEVLRLRALNHQLIKRLQGQAALEAEVARLKCLLVDIRGRIHGEIGSFPYQKLGKAVDGSHATLSGGFVLDPCDLTCDDQVYCFHQGIDGKGVGANGPGHGVCPIGNVPCMGNSNFGPKELLVCGGGDAITAGDNNASSPIVTKQKGVRASTGG